jgi:hypothetical protein
MESRLPIAPVSQQPRRHLRGQSNDLQGSRRQSPQLTGIVLPKIFIPKYS